MGMKTVVYDDPNELVVIRDFSHEYEAELARVLLEAADIPSVFIREWGEGLGTGRVRLSVRRADVDAAVEALEPAPQTSLDEDAPPDAQAADLTRNASSEDQRTIRERVTRLAFGGDARRFDDFVRAIADATPADVQVILRGSAVTGHKWLSDEPFDADGPGTSDLDVTFVGGDMVTLFREFHIPAIHSAPLSDAHPFASPPLGALRKRLCAITGRPVNLQATTSLVQFLRDVVMGQPYLVLLEKREDDEADRSEVAHDD
jgi:hypothetical protein